MSKYFKGVLFLISALFFVFFNKVNIFAMEAEDESIFLSDANILITPSDESVELISFDAFGDGIQNVIINEYVLKDGSLIIDTVTNNVQGYYYREVTRTKTLAGWGTLSITAGFEWYTEGMFSYVRCTGMTSSFIPDNDSVMVSGDISTSYTSNYVALGKANASANCTLVRHIFGTELNYLSLVIECSDEGTISVR